MVLGGRGRVDLEVNEASSQLQAEKCQIVQDIQRNSCREHASCNLVTCKNEARGTSAWSSPQVPPRLLQNGSVTPTHGVSQRLRRHPGTGKLEHFQGQLLTGLIVYSN